MPGPKMTETTTCICILVRQQPGRAAWPWKVPESELYWWVTQPMSAHSWSRGLLELPVAFCAPNYGLSTIVDIVVSFRGAMLNHLDCHLWSHVGSALLIYLVLSFSAISGVLAHCLGLMGKLVLHDCLSCELLSGCFIFFSLFFCGDIPTGMLFFVLEAVSLCCVALFGW